MLFLSCDTAALPTPGVLSFLATSCPIEAVLLVGSFCVLVFCPEQEIAWDYSSLANFLAVKVSELPLVTITDYTL